MKLKILSAVPKKIEAPNQLETNPLFGSKSNAFTIIELIIILVVLSILVSIAVPEVLSARKETRGLMCGAALNQIEAAKSAWKREFPGAPLNSTNDLLRYLPSGFPKDPWGIGFNNVTNLNTPVSHDYNGQAAFEPAGSSAPGWLENGYNDLGTPIKN
jgi:hypothetical protein